MADTKTTEDRMKEYLVWKLQHDVDRTRDAIIHRSRSLADRLTRLADSLEADPDYTVNSIGELQGSGVELDTWCARLAFARETLKLFRQAMSHAEVDAE